MGKPIRKDLKRTELRRMKSAKPSAMMISLYGKQYAQTVQSRLQELDPDLDSIIQDVAYEVFWRRKGLSLRDKALITVAALVAMGKEEQTRIHMTGFLNAGGNASDLKNALLHLAIYCGFPATMNGFAALKDVLRSKTENSGQSKKRKNKKT